MTLDTRIYVHDEIDVPALFRFCQTVLTKYDEKHRRPEQQASYMEQDWSFLDEQQAGKPDPTWTMANQLGQGLPAILDISYRPDAAYRTADEAAAHDEFCNIPEHDDFDPTEPVCDGNSERYTHRPACWAQISLDTAYGYNTDGMGCGELHALVVAHIGKHLDAQGVAWSWLNEFTGEIHTGYERLPDLASGGSEAAAWLRDLVMPAIAGTAAENN